MNVYGTYKELPLTDTLSGSPVEYVLRCDWEAERKLLLAACGAARVPLSNAIPHPQDVDATDKALKLIGEVMESEPPKCEGCGTDEDITLGPCPYAYDVNGDDTPVWLCKTCSQQRADDV